MDAYDAVVVGGGPAGSSCARVLKRAGLSVAIVDKSCFPRDKVCAGWITPQVIEALQLDIAQYAQALVFQPITGFAAAVGHKQGLPVSYDHPVSYAIRRCEFDDYLLRRSAADLKLGEPVRSLRRHDGQWLINDTIRAPLVIGAGGHFCPVAQHLGASLGRTESAVSAQEIEFESSEAQAEKSTVSRTVPELYFCADLKGYAWCVRKGRYFNVGLGREDNHGLTARVRDFWSWLVASGKVPVDVRPRFHGHAYLTRTHSQRVPLDDGLLLIGDAAGLAYPESGEGIRPAIESGLLAAQVVLNAGGHYSRDCLGEYSVLLQDRFGATGARSPSAGPSAAKALAARLLMRLPWFVRHIVLERSFLHMHQPALIS